MAHLKALHHEGGGQLRPPALLRGGAIRPSQIVTWYERLAEREMGVLRTQMAMQCVRALDSLARLVAITAASRYGCSRSHTAVWLLLGAWTQLESIL
mmetsp:Transcript_2312/g.7416  ORF Transcript_2312/g.7416 Transcript_2312/m.7416 type:complete len:97 (+) Transcript_2312:674-964(+)